MNIKSLYSYYSFGFNYSRLLSGKSGVKIKDAIDSIKDFIDFIKEHDLKVTKTAVKEDL